MLKIVPCIIKPIVVFEYLWNILNRKLVNFIFLPLRKLFASSFSAVADSFWYCVDRYDHLLVHCCERIFAPGLRHFRSIRVLISRLIFFPTYVLVSFWLCIGAFLPSLSPPLRTMFVFGLRCCGWVWDFTFDFLSDFVFCLGGISVLNWRLYRSSFHHSGEVLAFVIRT